MEGSLTANYPQFTRLTDRRQQNLPVDSERRSNEDRRNNTDLFNKIDSLDKKADSAKTMFSALSPVIPLRRISSVPESIENHDYERASGLVAVAALMLPEDLRDMKDAWFQITKNKQPLFDYKNCQAPFRFVRGTLAEKIINMMGRYGYYIHEFDKSIAETKLGKNLRKLLKISTPDKEYTGRNVDKVLKIGNKYKTIETRLFAEKLSGSFLGKLIYRAMQRTTVIGALILSALWIPSVIKTYKKSEKTEDKIANAGKQTLKSVINVASVLSGIGISGALGASKYKYVGSVIGMGIGSVAGSLASDKINQNINIQS